MPNSLRRFEIILENVFFKVLTGTEVRVALACSMGMGSISAPTTLAPIRIASCIVVPPPIIGSRMICPSNPPGL